MRYAPSLKYVWLDNSCLFKKLYLIENDLIASIKWG